MSFSRRRVTEQLRAAGHYPGATSTRACGPAASRPTKARIEKEAMMAARAGERTVAERLKELGVKGVLIQMANHGQLLESDVRDADVLLPEGARALRSLARSATRARTQVVTERRPLPNLEKGRRKAEAVERAVGARPLQQHGLRLAHAHPLDAREGSRALVRGNRRDVEQEGGRASATTCEVVDSRARSKGVRVVQP